MCLINTQRTPLLESDVLTVPVRANKLLETTF